MMLWYTEPLIVTSGAQQSRMIEGLRLHLRYGQLISVLVRLAAAERSYLTLDGCSSSQARVKRMSYGDHNGVHARHDGSCPHS